MPIGITDPSLVSLGENSRMLVGGVHQGLQNGIWIAFVTGAVSVGGAEGDQTDNMSGGFSVPTRGPRMMRVSAECLWKSSLNPIGNLPKFKVLQTTDRIVIWPDYLNDQGQYFKMPIGFCLGFDITVAGTADTRFNLTLRNFGTFYYPAEPDPAGPLA